MTELNGKTPDIAEENIAKLQEIFPDVFEEGKVDFDKLKQVLGDYVDDSTERYNFSWNGKGRALRFAQSPSTGTLRPCPEESKDWDTTQNLYIEGDNLEVLKLLQKSYHGKVKMIYIDPPYNTGGDFVYPDDYSDSMENYLRITGQKGEDGAKISTNTESNGRYHTDWLNMIYPRLRLARNLLTDDGVIFISIDDNEVENLRKTCDEVYGESNFVGTIANTNNPKGRSDDKYIATAHEYVLIYAKSLVTLTWYGFEPTEEIIRRYNKADEYGKLYREIDLRKTGENDLREDRPNLFYYFYFNEITHDFYPSKVDETLDGYIQIKPQREDLKEGNWRWGLETAKKKLSTLIPKFMPTRKVWGIMEKDFLENRTLVKPTSSWIFKDVNSERGSEDFITLGFEKRIFTNPKPIGTVYRCLKLSTCSQNDLILDFFSGSSTTAHAIMRLNTDDGGKRKFIMVQLPEACDEASEAFKAGYKNICDIGKERIRRAGDKIKEESGFMAQNLDIGFKVLKLDTSNVKKWNAEVAFEMTEEKQLQFSAEKLEEILQSSVSNFVAGRTETDVVYEIMIKMGLDLTYQVEIIDIDGKKVYSVALGALMICLADNISTAVAEGMVNLYKEKNPETWKVVFKDNGFADDSTKTNVREILKCAGLNEDAFTTL